MSISYSSLEAQTANQHKQRYQNINMLIPVSLA